MIRQRPSGAAPAVQAAAQTLPFADGAFEAGLAVLTVHHWPDPLAGLRELRRVVRGRIVILTFDPAARPWLTDYIPGLAALDEAQMPALDVYEAALGPVRITPLAIPHDCTDGFLYAYWRRPEAYLDARIRSGSSSFRALADTGAGLERLRADLESGEWGRRYGGLRRHDAYDAGYRIVSADGSPGSGRRASETEPAGLRRDLQCEPFRDQGVRRPGGLAGPVRRQDVGGDRVQGLQAPGAGLSQKLPLVLPEDP